MLGLEIVMSGPWGNFLILEHKVSFDFIPYPSSVIIYKKSCTGKLAHHSPTVLSMVERSATMGQLRWLGTQQHLPATTRPQVANSWEKMARHQADLYVQDDRNVAVHSEHLGIHPSDSRTRSKHKSKMREQQVGTNDLKNSFINRMIWQWNCLPMAMWRPTLQFPPWIGWQWCLIKQPQATSAVSIIAPSQTHT